MIRRLIIIIILVAFLSTSIQTTVFAVGNGLDHSLHLPKPGEMLALSSSYMPALLKGMVINPGNALQFDFLIHPGDELLSAEQKKEQYNKLIKYFLASLAVPDENQWVNLSPYEKDRLIKDDFGKTEMGRDLLAQDYILKQITASLIYPESNLGQQFWNKVYAQAQEQFGTSNVPMNTFNKVWIVPDEAQIYEKGNTVYIVEQHLKVMLEEDYVSMVKNTVGAGLAPALNTRAPARGARTDVNQIGSQIVREIVLPALEKEVNEGKNFAMLRQVYGAALLAEWYKRSLKESLLGQVYSDKAKLKGIEQADVKDNQVIYQQYLKAFKQGVFNYIKEEKDQLTKQAVPRKYFSGGCRVHGGKILPASPEKFDLVMSNQADRLEAVTTQLTPDGAMNAAVTQADAQYVARESELLLTGYTRFWAERLANDQFVSLNHALMKAFAGALANEASRDPSQDVRQITYGQVGEAVRAAVVLVYGPKMKSVKPWIEEIKSDDEFYVLINELKADIARLVKELAFQRLEPKDISAKGLPNDSYNYVAAVLFNYFTKDWKNGNFSLKSLRKSLTDIRKDLNGLTAVEIISRGTNPGAARDRVEAQVKELKLRLDMFLESLPGDQAMTTQKRFDMAKYRYEHLQAKAAQGMTKSLPKDLDDARKEMEFEAALLAREGQASRDDEPRDAAMNAEEIQRLKQDYRNSLVAIQVVSNKETVERLETARKAFFDALKKYKEHPNSKNLNNNGVRARMYDVLVEANASGEFLESELDKITTLINESFPDHPMTAHLSLPPSGSVDPADIPVMTEDQYRQLLEMDHADPSKFNSSLIGFIRSYQTALGVFHAILSSLDASEVLQSVLDPLDLQLPLNRAGRDVENAREALINGLKLSANPWDNSTPMTNLQILACVFYTHGHLNGLNINSTTIVEEREILRARLSTTQASQGAASTKAAGVVKPLPKMIIDSVYQLVVNEEYYSGLPEKDKRIIGRIVDYFNGLIREDPSPSYFVNRDQSFEEFGIPLEQLQGYLKQMKLNVGDRSVGLKVFINFDQMTITALMEDKLTEIEINHLLYGPQAEKGLRPLINAYTDSLAELQGAYVGNRIEKKEELLKRRNVLIEGLQMQDRPLSWKMGLTPYQIQSCMLFILKRTLSMSEDLRKKESTQIFDLLIDSADPDAAMMSRREREKALSDLLTQAKDLVVTRLEAKKGRLFEAELYDVKRLTSVAEIWSYMLQQKQKPQMNQVFPDRQQAFDEIKKELWPLVMKEERLKPRVELSWVAWSGALITPWSNIWNRFFAQPIGADQALVAVEQKVTPGGIDLNTSKSNLQIKRDSQKIVLALTPQDLSQFVEMKGLIPVIREIKPAAMLPAFVEFKNSLTPSR